MPGADRSTFVQLTQMNTARATNDMQTHTTRICVSTHDSPRHHVPPKRLIGYWIDANNDATYTPAA